MKTELTYQHLEAQFNDPSWSDKLVEVFKILATQSYESKCHAYKILEEQEFKFSTDDINKLTKIWKILKENEKDDQILDEETLEMIKDAYEGYKAYSNNEDPPDTKLS